MQGMQVMEVASSTINAGLHCPNPTGEPVGRAAARRAPSRVRGAVLLCSVLVVLLHARCSSVHASSECAACTGVARACRARGMGSGLTLEVTFQGTGPGVAGFASAAGSDRGVAADIVPPFFSKYKLFSQLESIDDAEHRYLQI